MAIRRERVPAGQQFGDANNPGLFGFGKSNVEVKRLSLKMGSESKDVTVTVVDEHGNEFGMLYKKLAMTNLNVDLVGMMPIGPGEQIKIVTASATSEMFVTVVY